MKRVLLVTAAFVAAVTVCIVVSLPPRALSLQTLPSDGSVAGILHIHTNRSDGRSGLDEIAAAAARAGLKFIVFTDHGNATLAPEPPAYRSGVLCLDGVEISTSGGHYIAMGMGASPYPLGGDPSDVVEDVRRLGGFGIAAHPDSPKSELAWHAWDAPVDGVELLNPDTSWRVHANQGGWRPRIRILGAIGTYAFRPSETIGDLLTASADARARWSRSTTDRPVVGIAGADAHAKIELRAARPGDNRYSLPIPGYEASFRAISVHVTPAESLTGEAEADASRVLAAIRRGALYTAVDAWGAPPHFSFTATTRSGVTVAGGEVRAADDLELQVRHNGGNAFTTSIWRGAESVAADIHDGNFSWPVGMTPGAYRVEVRDGRHLTGPPWITSNPIYVRSVVPSTAASAPPVQGSTRSARLALFDGRTTTNWATESDPTSLSAVDVVPVVAGSELRVRFGMSGGPMTGQFSGVAVQVPTGVAAYDRVSFSIRAEHPMRVSVQVRAEVNGAPPERWQRSIYVDDRDRNQSLFFDDMRPVGVTLTPRPPSAAVRAVMFIVDTTNTAPGASGRLWLRDVRLER